MNYIIGETQYKLCRRGFKNNKVTKLRKTSHAISSLDLILAYLNSRARTWKWFWWKVKMKMQTRDFCSDRGTCIWLTLLLRTTIKAELKHKTKQKADVWKYWKATKVTRSPGPRFNTERTYIISPKFVIILSPKSICLHAIWGLEAKGSCRGSCGSLADGGDKSGRAGWPRQSRKCESESSYAVSPWGVYYLQRMARVGQEA